VVELVGDRIIKAKHLRTYKPKRKAERGNALFPEEYSAEITLSWSESGVPVRTLKKDRIDYPTAYSFIGFGCGDPDNEDVIARYALDIPNPSAQKAKGRN
jgi:hypothetical protein